MKKELQGNCHVITDMGSEEMVSEELKRGGD
jgi:hypothetical protein